MKGSALDQEKSLIVSSQDMFGSVSGLIGNMTA